MELERIPLTILFSNSDRDLASCEQGVNEEWQFLPFQKLLFSTLGDPFHRQKRGKYAPHRFLKK